MICKACGTEQREPLTFYPHWPRAASVSPLEAEPVPENLCASSYWACERCDRKHNRDGSLYYPERAA